MTALCLIFGLLGCANPGIPRPPSLRLPATVTDLSGVRVGDRVELHWTAPSRTTDGLDLTGLTTVEICRDPAPAQPVPPPNAPSTNPAATAPCTPVFSTTGHPGESTAVAQLPASLIGTAGQQHLVAYRVRILNSAGRSAPPSAPVLVPGGAALAMVAGFRAEQQKTGVLLEWSKTGAETPPGGTASRVEVQRTIQRTQLDTFVAQSSKPSGAAKRSKSNSPDPFARREHAENAPTIRLQQEAGVTAVSPSSQLDGMVDQSAVQQETYSYSAQRVLTVSVAGKTVEIRSEPTVPITIAMRDTFPPLPPRGLITVPGMIGPSSTGQTDRQTTIDLAWEPNAEPDLTGYLVYRVDLDAGKPNPVRLTAKPLPGPAYRDTAVVPGHRYLYRVTAVDRNGNESDPSADAEDAPDGR